MSSLSSKRIVFLGFLCATLGLTACQSCREEPVPAGDAGRDGGQADAGDMPVPGEDMGTGDLDTPDVGPGAAPVIEDFDSIRSLLDGPLAEGTETQTYEELLDDAQTLHRTGEHCPAADTLVEAMQAAQQMRQGDQTFFVDRLYVLTRQARADVIVETGNRGECPGHERVALPTRPTVTAQSPDGVSANVEFGSPRMFNQVAAGSIWTGISLPEFELNTDQPGSPGIPKWRELIAVPLEADITLTSAEREVAETVALNLLPHQIAGVDQIGPPEGPDFDAPPYQVETFSIDEELYDSDATYPETPCTLNEAGMLRDLRVVQVECAAGEYDFDTEQLSLYSSVSFDVTFDGPDAFVREASMDPFESGATALDVILNNDEAVIHGEIASDIEPEVVGPLPVEGRCDQFDHGEELAILTPPEFQEQALRLATHKRERGLMANVLVVADGPGGKQLDDFQQIKGLLLSRYVSCGIRMRYVLILGDSDKVPPGRLESHPGPHLSIPGFDDGTKAGPDDEFIGTDINYGRMTSSWSPEVIVGRLPVRTDAQATRSVERIIQHENAPPTDEEFFDTINAGGLFQCCRADRRNEKANFTLASGERKTVRFRALGILSEGVFTGLDLPFAGWVRVASDDPVAVDVTIRDGRGDTVADFPSAGDGALEFESTTGGTHKVDIVNNASDPVEFDFEAKWWVPPTLQTVDPGTDERWYIETLELVRRRMLGRGFLFNREPKIGNFNRIYVSPEHPGLYPFDDATPARYHDGAPVHPALRDFVWDADGDDIKTALEGNGFLFVHRDHGWPGGWAAPGFETWRAQALSNEGRLPIVFSINCSTGKFANEVAPDDDPTATFFAEGLIRGTGGGAVSVLAPVRPTGTHTNNHITKGLFDAIWPELLPTFGRSNDRKMRLGDVYRHAMKYMLRQGSISPPGKEPNDTTKQLIFWQVIGDPSLLVRTEPPETIDVTYEASVSATAATVQYAEDGATVTAFQRGNGVLRPVGRSEVLGGEANIEFFVEPDPGIALEYSVELPDGTAAMLTGEVADASGIADPGVFTANATTIGFDSPNVIEPGQPLGTTYSSEGVEFEVVSPNLQSIVAVDMDSRNNSTISPPHAALNQTDEETFPVIMQFDPPVTRVGTYVGNGTTNVRARLEAFDAAGRQLATTVLDEVPLDVEGFIGIEAESDAIARVHLVYPEGGEEIFDDLMFE